MVTALYLPLLLLHASSPSSSQEAKVSLTFITPDGSVSSMGEATFTQSGSDTTIKSLTVTGLDKMATNKENGVHIHALGNLGQGCVASTGHYNPTGQTHGDKDTVIRHIGDLGNMARVEDKITINNLVFKDNRLPLTGLNSIVGRALVVHSGKDDLGKGGNASSLANGNSGKRIACGVIGISKPYEIASDYPKMKNLPTFPLKATAFMFNGMKFYGTIEFSQADTGKSISASAKMKNLESDGLVRIGIQDSGFIGQGCENLGNLMIEKEIDMNIKSSKIEGKKDLPGEAQFLGPDSIIGRPILVHDINDKPIACGIIGINSDFGPAGVTHSEKGGANGKVGSCFVAIVLAFFIVILH